MRHAWTFLIGLFFAGFVMMWSAPIGIAVAVLAGLGGQINLFHAFSGESVFGVRDVGGRLQGRMVNVSFRPTMVPVIGEPRPRRLLLRLEVIDVDVFDGSNGLGRVRLDAWPLDGAVDVLQPPLYTVVAPGRKAIIDDENVLSVENGNRRSAYSLATGEWLYDADGAVVTYTTEGDRRRLLAAAAADDEMPPGSVAVVTLASPQGVLKRLLIAASDPTRARLLRTSVSLIRAGIRSEPAGLRWVDLAMPAGTIRVPLSGDVLDLARAEVPVGLKISEFKAWPQR
ncbi:hypothetical protein [Magnetospirillum gryphiswaldense]|uniref:Uncharacterized protein n=2 Tax=Magnetospirillum gryphiswaldense TaxID=55518 RepID=V6F2U1_MAGGM|nr:hypothetical protein [Magnetospirillum gryphiswaldense]AVM76264.1 hypothetical protein MSR1_38070 [Magnetospirillum gryphiswaldense MSR-1]AVM80167.1 hypothetical protein MSR1L_38070 [Magnetospirillum gryphiswaldense]CAM74803.1 conserved hypothetical protein, secreted [Magnetospirillum gryphiswaldense MSR-1]CDK99722.1 conserved exported protein of unknown function [Magnetospirillum gryphiswaldense MSR-1 v2]